MKGTQRTSAFASVLFVAGLAIVILGLLALAPYLPGGSRVFWFVAADVIVLYLLVFSPLVMGERVSDLTGGRIVSLGIYWYAVGAYALLTAFVLFSVCTSVRPPLMIYIVLQLAGLFCVALAAFFGDAAHGQVEEVEAIQEQQLSSVRDLRATSEQLAIAVSQIDTTGNTALGELATATERIADDLRYLTPVQTQQAVLLERRIQSDLDTLMAQTGHGDPTMIDVPGACDVARDALSLIARRKALRN